MNGPDLGLSTVDLNDGSYSTTKIYPASGVPGHTDVLETIGDFYVQFTGSLCAYDIPGGAIAMEFTGSNTVSVDDGAGGSYVQGNFDLDVTEANGLIELWWAVTTTWSTTYILSLPVTQTSSACA